MANPGEYTQRAFMNGKMDLSQAEAVADLIASSNSASHKVAMSQLRGHFSSELSMLRDQLLHLTSLLELELDFSDHEDLEFADRKELYVLAHRIQDRITTLSHSFKTGKAIKEGVPVAIIGKTNVGKSTLLNRLLHDDKAIVSDIHGTTRDVIEDTTVINGVTFRFIDTAGIRDTSDKIEQMGIERTYATIDKAKIILWLIDDNPSADELSDILSRSKDKSLIIVRNKIDKDDAPLSDNKEQKTVYISAKYDIGIESLENEIFQAADIPEISENDVIVTNIRHFDALRLAAADIQRVIDGLEAGISGDMLSEDLRSCIHHLADIVGGEITPNETLSTIFERFCVGK
jgi:tRNA modification GTPase